MKPLAHVISSRILQFRPLLAVGRVSVWPMCRSRTTTWLSVFSAAGVLGTSPLPAQKVAQEVAAGRAWGVDTVADKMDGTVTYWLVHAAKERLVGSLGVSRPALQIYCPAPAHKPYLQVVIGQIVVVDPGPGTVKVRVRQDTEAPKTESWSVSEDFSTVLPDAQNAGLRIQRIKRLAEGQLYLVEVPLDAAPDRAARVLEFEVSGLKALLPGLARGCGWKM